MKQTTRIGFILLAMILLSSITFAAAAGGGMGAVNTTLKLVVNGFVLFSKAVVTLAFLWVGYKVLFSGSALRDLAPIIIGALIIGSASVLADYFVATTI